LMRRKILLVRRICDQKFQSFIVCHSGIQITQFIGSNAACNT
jgi:hypothetical protein